jgi:hypothetical protein
MNLSDVSLGQLVMFKALVRARGAMEVEELRRQVGTSALTLHKATQDGSITVEPASTDARKKLVQLSPDFVALARATWSRAALWWLQPIAIYLLGVRSRVIIDLLDLLDDLVDPSQFVS